jgi:hypothetical protein
MRRPTRSPRAEPGEEARADELSARGWCAARALRNTWLQRELERAAVALAG